MEQSETIGKLAEALSKAQAIMDGAARDSANPFFKSKYADLSAVWDACRKPLTDNGLSVVQAAEFLPDHPEMVCIVTILCHSSGEWIKGRLAVKPIKPDPQSVGSCITYLRRYSLQSIAGIAPEDDDGNAASGQGTKSKAAYIPPKEEPSQPAPGDVPDFYGDGLSGSTPERLISESQAKRLFAIAKEAGWANDALKSYLIEAYQIDSTKKIPLALYDAIIACVQKGAPA